VFLQRGVDAALDQPRQRHAGKVGGDEREDTEDQVTTVTVDEKLDALVVTKNLSAFPLAAPDRRAKISLF
jgi:hypothetical protein